MLWNQLHSHLGLATWLSIAEENWRKRSKTESIVFAETCSKCLRRPVPFSQARSNLSYCEVGPEFLLVVRTCSRHRSSCLLHYRRKNSVPRWPLRYRGYGRWLQSPQDYHSMFGLKKKSVSPSEAIESGHLTLSTVSCRNYQQNHSPVLTQWHLPTRQLERAPSKSVETAQKDSVDTEVLGGCLATTSATIACIVFAIDL